MIEIYEKQDGRLVYCGSGAEPVKFRDENGAFKPEVGHFINYRHWPSKMPGEEPGLYRGKVVDVEWHQADGGLMAVVYVEREYMEGDPRVALPPCPECGDTFVEVKASTYSVVHGVQGPWMVSCEECNYKGPVTHGGPEEAERLYAQSYMDILRGIAEGCDTSDVRTERDES